MSYYKERSLRELVVDPIALGLVVEHDSFPEVSCLCPFHDDRSPSASFNMEKGVLYCFTCATSFSAKEIANFLGGTISLVKKSDKIRLLSTRGSHKKIKNWRHAALFPLALSNKYLQSRLVDNNMVKAYGIREWSNSVYFRLYSHTGNLIGIQERLIDNSKFRYIVHGNKPPLWPAKEVFSLTKSKTVYLTEGIFGMLRAKAAGLQAFALLGVGQLAEALVLLNGFNVIGVFDDDIAGYTASLKLAKRGIKTAYPTFTADEATFGYWRAFDQNQSTTTRASLILRHVKSKTKQKIIRNANRWYQKTR